MSRRILFALFFGLAGQASASGWLRMEGGRAEDFRRAAFSGGGSLDPAETLLLQGSLAQSLSQPPAGGDWVRSSDLGLGLGWLPVKAWDTSLDLNGGNDSTDARFGGGLLSLNGHADFGEIEPSLTLRGGATHYLFAPEESLRQNSGGVGLSVKLASVLTLDLSGNRYQYDRELYDGGSAGTVVTTPGAPGGLFGLVPGANGTSRVIGGSDPRRDPLLPGFPARDWSVGLSLEAGRGARLGADYSQTEIIESGVWEKIVGASWRQELNDAWALRLAWNKAVESGSDSPYFSLSLNWDLSPAATAAD